MQPGTRECMGEYGDLFLYKVQRVSRTGRTDTLRPGWQVERDGDVLYGGSNGQTKHRALAFVKGFQAGRRSE